MGYLNTPVYSWHLPEKRGVLPLDRFHVSRSLARTLKQGRFLVTFDQAFPAVMEACAKRAEDDDGGNTWITPRIQEVYGQLYARGYAHSVEVWVDGTLAGGTYGIHLGAAFFAESKFHTVANMSKVALAHLVAHLKERNFSLLDVQYWTPHLDQFGVEEVDRNEYYRRLREALRQESSFS